MSNEILEDCTLCPRKCHVNRIAGKKGYCGKTEELVVARAALHFWEEPCISGKTGSGTVFFSGCSVRCVFCQNAMIAKGEQGKVISVRGLSNIFLQLQEKGAHNINLVTPTHYVPHIITAVMMAKQEGLKLPIVYNTSGYERKETIGMLKGIVDIYLTDMKYWNSEAAERYSNAADYFSYASKALAEMVRQVSEPVFDQDGLMLKGVIVRHLQLPGQVDDSKKIIRYLYETYKDQIFISIMNQYTPMPWLQDYPELRRRVKKKEYNRVVDYALRMGVVNAFIQEGATALESFIPEFNGEGVEVD